MVLVHKYCLLSIGRALSIYIKYLFPRLHQKRDKILLIWLSAFLVTNISFDVLLFVMLYTQTSEDQFYGSTVLRLHKSDQPRPQLYPHLLQVVCSSTSSPIGHLCLDIE